MNPTVLFVDDDPNILAAHQRNFRKKFTVEVALGAEEALAAVAGRGPFAVIVADMQMPGMNGVEFLEKAEEAAPDTVRMMLTGNIDQNTAADAINKGRVHRFLTKPCPPEILGPSIEEGVKHHQLVTAEKQLLEKTLAGSIRVLVDTLALVEPQSFGMGEKLREATKAFTLARRTSQAWAYEIAALLSQVGFVTIPPAVAEKARKGGHLSGAEKDMILRAPEVGYGLIRNIPRLETVAEIVRYQQKNFDGTGAPFDPIAGEAIPHGSRLLKILTEVVAGEARGVPRVQRLLQMQNDSGQFDPKLVAEVLESLRGEGDGPAVAASGKPKREIKLAELRVGHRLVTNLMTPDGLVVVAAGNEITPLQLERIRNFAQLQRLVEPFWIQGGE